MEALSIYSGGPIDKKFSYFFEYYMHERAGDGAGAPSRSKLADAYLFYNSDAAADTFYWVRAGQIYPYLIYYYGSGGRLSISRNEAINRSASGGNNYTPRDHAYGVSGGYVYEGKFLGEVGTTAPVETPTPTSPKRTTLRTCTPRWSTCWTTTAAASGFTATLGSSR